MGEYSHVADLLILAGWRPLDDTHSRLLPREWSSIRTPMCADVWTSLLLDHPDRAYCGFRSSCWISDCVPVWWGCVQKSGFKHAYCS